MPFTSSAPNFFGRMGAQTSPTNFGNPMDVFAKADATRSAMPNLFSTIQAVRANELERQTKQAAISKVLQDLAIQQQLAPVELALNQAKVDAAPSEALLRDAQMKAAMAKAEKDSAYAKRTPQTLADQMREIQALGAGGGFAPGSSVSVSDKGATFNLPLVREANTEETNILAASENLRGLMPSAKQLIQSGVFKDVDNSNIIRAFATQQIAGGSGGDAGRFLLNKYGGEKAKQLTQLRGIINGMQTNYFALAGKALTTVEKEVVGGLLSQTGKSDEQRLQDLDTFQRLFTIKENFIKNGIINAETGEGSESMDSVLAKIAPQSTGNSSSLRQEAMEAISQGADRAKVAERFKSMTGENL